MNAQIPHSRDYGFLIGLLTGACVGVGLTMWLAPASTGEVRDRVAASAGEVRDRVAASARRMAEEMKGRSDDFRDHVADAVTRGAHDVEQFAAVVKTDRRNV